MSKDIRSFFTIISKKNIPETKQESKKKPNRLIDSDDDDVIECTPEKNKTKLSSNKRKQGIIVSSESDDEPTKNKQSKFKEQEPNLKAVNVDEIFVNRPIKQCQVVNRSKIEVKQDNKGKISKSKKKIINTESGIHEDTDFEKTLEELDDDILMENLDVLDRTVNEALSIKEEVNEIKPVDHEDKKKGSKRGRMPSKGSTPKKIKLEHVDSGIDPDEEAFERRRYSAMLYDKFKNRGGPKMHGQKELPKGNPDCLKNLTFLRTGVLDSLESEEFENLVAEHGGRVVKGVSKKVNYIVVGEDAGPSKLEKSSLLGIRELNEDQFLDLILTKSGKNPKYVGKSDDSQDSEIFHNESKKSEKSKSEDKKIDSSSEGKERDKSVKNSDKQENEDNTSKLDKKETKNNHKEEILKIKAETHVKLEKKPTLEHKTSSEIFGGLKTEQSKSITDDAYVPWTEKYKPIEAKNIIGQQGDSSNLRKLRVWLNNWHRNQLPDVKKKIQRPSPYQKNDGGAFYKAALLSGPPGVGKTTTATLVSKELGFDVVEFNASDTRSKRLLHEEVSQLLHTNTIAGFASGKLKTDKKRVLIMDEVDGMAGNEDRGGILELINLIKKTNVPIICTCNNRNHQKMRSLVNYCFDLRFTPPKLEQIRSAMMSICFKEGLKLSPNVVSELIISTGLDIRQTLNHLTMHAVLNKQNHSEEDQCQKSKDSKKDTVLGPWEIIRNVFTESEQKKTLSEKTKLFFYDYSLGPLFIQENYLGVTPNCPMDQILKRLALAADAISKGDVIDGKIRSLNGWTLLENQAIESSVMPGYYMSGNITSRINFPKWLGKNSSLNKHKRLLSELNAHSRKSISGGALAIKLDYLPPLRDAIINPMLKYGAEGVNTSVDVMQNYNLLREDLNNLTELCQWKNNTNPFQNVDPKVKAAFTRTYNKVCQKVSFATKAATSKGKVSDDIDNILDDNLSESDTEETNDVNTDSLIKVKTRAKTTDGKKGAASKTKKPTQEKKKQKKSK